MVIKSADNALFWRLLGHIGFDLTGLLKKSGKSVTFRINAGTLLWFE